MSKPIDLESTLVAGAAGAILMVILFPQFSGYTPDPNDGRLGGDMWLPLTGFAVGAGVQIGVRALGVS